MKCTMDSYDLDDHHDKDSQEARDSIHGMGTRDVIEEGKKHGYKDDVGQEREEGEDYDGYCGGDGVEDDGYQSWR
jgi:hypothetical protein